MQEIQKFQVQIRGNHGQQNLTRGGGGMSTAAPEHYLAPGPHLSLYGPEKVTIKFKANFQTACL